MAGITLADLFLKLPPYDWQPILQDREGQEFLTALMFGELKLDGYCVQCGRSSVFDRNDESSRWASQATAGFVNQRSHISGEYTFLVSFECAREASHRMPFMFVYRDFQLCKVGQFPSLADLHMPELTKYAKVLGTRQKELVKGVGLASHAVGIGSFVYLRRVFEHLIEEAVEIQRHVAGWDEEAFFKQRMDEKIQTLRSHLPAFLVENRSLYGILSKGIHSLEEAECLDCFPAVLAAIEMILDQKLHIIEQAEKAKKAASAIAALKSVHGNKP